MYRRGALEVIAQKAKTMALKADHYLDELCQEIQSSALELFVTKVDNLYKVAIQQHYNSFHCINEPLLATTTKAKLFDILSTHFPMHCSVLESICTTDHNQWLPILQWAIGPQIMFVGVTDMIDANFDCSSTQKEANMASTQMEGFERNTAFQTHLRI
jgi:hypothetical protein